MNHTVTEVLPLVWDLYDRNGVGCCLHIVLDDGNIRDNDVEFCIGQAATEGHKDCEDLARKLLGMSKTQRKILSSRAYERIFQGMKEKKNEITS